MAKPVIKMRKLVAPFGDIDLGDTFIVTDGKIQRLCIKCDRIHENDGETVVWNAVNLATGEAMHFKDDEIIKLVDIEIEVM